MLLSRLINSSINYRIFRLSVSYIILGYVVQIIPPFSPNFIVNYEQFVFFNYRFQFEPTSTFAMTTSAITLSTVCITTRYYCGLLRRNQVTNIAITLNCGKRDCYCYELQGSVIKSAVIFYHVEFESSIASHRATPRATPVFVEIWIIRNLQNFSNYNLLLRLIFPGAQ